MDPSSYSGAGGKIQRRPISRASASTTPYDLPPAAAAAHHLAAATATAGSSAGYQGPGGEGEGDGEGGGWVSRLVDSASHLIAGGTARLFSTVFRKRIGSAPRWLPLRWRPPRPRLTVLVDQWIRMLSEFIDAGHDMILAADSSASDVIRGIATVGFNLTRIQRRWLLITLIMPPPRLKVTTPSMLVMI